MHPVALRIDAPNDTNGNPRRGWLVFDANTGKTIAFIDEGYQGERALRLRYSAAVSLGSVNVKPAEYRFHLRADYAVHS